MYIFCCYSFLVNRPLYHYTHLFHCTFLSFSLFCSIYTVFSVFFRMDCFPSFHFSIFPNFRLVSYLCPLTNLCSFLFFKKFFFLLLFSVAPAMHACKVKDKHPDKPFSCQLYSERMYWKLPPIMMFWDSLVNIFFHTFFAMIFNFKKLSLLCYLVII